eukprot:CAMPEP_0195086354 /NCGR_PEP_ID=MMETSP0448-20130528/26519_1 /TAXON_ID=66468 /ORGANISM="Heterocapsa triquestra, Strain CCMP 448" /LENGTH=74 /DNA_ID=CAMNT_0040119829 /DNA_START=44 /DNA_END=264 /DNA_ORIENTATION=+
MHAAAARSGLCRRGQLPRTRPGAAPTEVRDEASVRTPTLRRAALRKATLVTDGGSVVTRYGCKAPKPRSQATGA